MLFDPITSTPSENKGAILGVYDWKRLNIALVGRLLKSSFLSYFGH